MNSLRTKLQQIEARLSAEHGPFALFALFLPEDRPRTWDVLVSAPWIAVDKADGLRIVATEIQNALTPEELMSISRVVILDPDNPFLPDMHALVQVEHGTDVELRDTNLFGVDVKRAYVITSQPVAASA